MVFNKSKLESSQLSSDKLIDTDIISTFTQANINSMKQIDSYYQSDFNPFNQVDKNKNMAQRALENEIIEEFLEEKIKLFKNSIDEILELLVEKLANGGQ